jgi:hypothetical protein
LKAAGIKGLVRHDFRHQYVTEALEAGIHPKVAADITGHAEEITNQRFYQITSNKVAKKAEKKLSGRLLKKGGALPLFQPQEGEETKAVTPGRLEMLVDHSHGSRPVVPSRYPSKEILQAMVNEKPVTIIAKELGVSDKAVERECRKLGIIKPGRGDWAKKKAGIKINPSKKSDDLKLQAKHLKPSVKPKKED